MDTMPVGEQTSVQQQVGAFAHTAEDYARMERNAAVRESNRLRVENKPGQAARVFYRSWMRQVRILGLSYAAIPGRPYDQGGGLP